jgi:hypothetical protein
MTMRLISAVSATASKALHLMAKQDLRLICHPGLGVFVLTGNATQNPIAIRHDVADALLERGLVSLAPEECRDDLVFLLTAEGIRAGREAETAERGVRRKRSAR